MCRSAPFGISHRNWLSRNGSSAIRRSSRAVPRSSAAAGAAITSAATTMASQATRPTAATLTDAISGAPLRAGFRLHSRAMEASTGGDATPSLSALGVSGRTGLHVLADALGVRWIAVGDGACELRLAESPLLSETRESVLAISVAADVCGCNAARSAVAVGARISTTGLSLSLLREPEPGELTAEGSVHGLGKEDGGRGRPFASAVRIADCAGPLAIGLVTGRVGHGERLPPLPWEDGAGAARRRTPGPEVVAALRRVEEAPEPRTRTMLTAERVDGGAEFELAIVGRPLLHNRVGHLQGGVAPAVADLAARDLLRDRGRPVLRALQWSFRGPVVEAERLRFEVGAGERSAHVTVSATEGGRLRGAGILEYGT